MNISKKICIFTFFSSTALTAIHIYNRFTHYISTSNHYLNEENGNYYNWRFGNIYYEKKGAGKPILLIHDLNVCSSSYEWNKVIKTLSETNTVYTLDLLGCGNSDKPNLTYTNYLYVQLITDFIKNIIKDKTDIIVTGESASIAIMTCANDDSIINRILLINPINMASLAKIPDKNSKFFRFLLCTPFLGTLLYNISFNKKTIKNLFVSTYFYNQHKISEKDIFTYFESCHKQNTKGKFLFSSIIGLYTNINILAGLKKLNNDIFIIIGNTNPENKLSADQYQNQLPSIEIIEMEEAKLLPHLEKPKEFIEKLKLLFEIE